MTSLFRNTFFAALLATALTGQAADSSTSTYPEFDFIKQFSGKKGEYVLETLGQPFKKETRNNASGTIEFWLYKNLVKQGRSEKLYKYTQIGIVNGVIETVGNTNIDPK